MWCAIYLGKMPTLARKIQVAFDWAWALLFLRDIVQLSKRETERVPSAHWTLEQLRARRDSLMQYGGGVDEAALAKLVQLLRYIDSDYQDLGTYTRLRQAVDGATRPVHYLAIPPSLFGTVVEALGQSGCARRARVITEKPFGRDLAKCLTVTRTKAN